MYLLTTDCMQDYLLAADYAVRASQSPFLCGCVDSLD